MLSFVSFSELNIRLGDYGIILTLCGSGMPSFQHIVAQLCHPFNVVWFRYAILSTLCGSGMPSFQHIVAQLCHPFDVVWFRHAILSTLCDSGIPLSQHCVAQGFSGWFWRKCLVVADDGLFASWLTWTYDL